MIKQFFRNISYLAEDSTKNIIRSLVSSFGILFLISFMVLYISFRDSVKKYVDESLFGKLAIDEIKIVPKVSTKTSVLGFTQSSSKSISFPVAAKIKNMPELSAVYSVVKLDYYSKVKAELMGKNRSMYMPLCGIEPEFFKDKDKRWKRFKDKTPIPVVAPMFALDIFNDYMSQNDLPEMSAKELVGFPLQLMITTTPPYAEEKKTYNLEAVIHSFSDKYAFPGLLVPKSFLFRFIKEHKADSDVEGPAYKYIMIYAKVKDVKKIPEITQKIKAMGVEVESDKDVAEKANKALSIIDGFSFVIIGIFLILTVISIFNSYLTIVYIRTQKFSLERVLGVSKIRIVFSFVVEAAMVGALYGIIGYYAGNYLLSYFSANIANWVPALGGIKIQSQQDNLLMIALVSSAAISSLSALVPAIFASNINLFKAVRK